jgi:hypothetical protein
MPIPRLFSGRQPSFLRLLLTLLFAVGWRIGLVGKIYGVPETGGAE